MADAAFYLMLLFCKLIIGTSERRPRQMLTCGLECTVAQSWEESWVRNAGSTMSGQRMSLWPTKWRLEGYQGNNSVFKVQLLQCTVGTIFTFVITASFTYVCVTFSHFFASLCGFEVKKN